MAVTSEPGRDGESIPEHIGERTEAMLGRHPPTNPNVVLETAKWWYNNGRGGNDPVYQLCVSWLAKLVNKADEDVFVQEHVLESSQHYGEVREYVEANGLDPNGGI